LPVSLFAATQYFGHVTGSGGGTELVPDTYPPDPGADAPYLCGSYPTQTQTFCNASYAWQHLSSWPSNIGIGGATVDGTYYFNIFDSNGGIAYDASKILGYYKWTVTGCPGSCVWSTPTNLELGTTTRILRKNAPSDNYNSTDDTVVFDFDYYNGTNNVPYTYAGVAISDLTNKIEYGGNYENAIVVSGEASYTQSIDLPLNAFYTWRPYLRTASSTSVIYGTYSNFYLGAPLQSQAPTIRQGFGTTSTTSLVAFPSSTSTDSYGGISSQIASKFPFSYIYDINIVFSELSKEPDLAYKITVPMMAGGASSTLTIMNFQDVASKPLVINIKTAIKALIWFLFAVYCINILRRV